MTLLLVEKPLITIKGYGWHPQLPDFRDYLYEPETDDLSAAADIIANKTTIDLRTSGWMPEPYDQSELGSCTANSGAGDMEYTAKRLGIDIGGTPSRLFIYYNERAAQGTIDEDSGASIRGSMIAMSTYGAPPETEWPYDIDKFTNKPPVKDFTDALKDVVLTYSAVKRSEEDIVASLLAKKCVQIGFTVYESFESDIGSNGIMPWPKKGEQVLGGHAVLVCGVIWINGDMYWIVRNSWGSDWADSGYFFMPAKYLITRGYASDYWNINVEGAKAA